MTCCEGTDNSCYEDPTTWRLRTTQGTPFRVLERSGTFGEEEATAQEQYLVEASKLLNFIEEAYPQPIIIGNTIQYPKPVYMPGLPLVPRRIHWKAHVDGIPIDPFGTDLGAKEGTYGKIAHVTVDYASGKRRVEENDDDPYTFLEISTDTTGEFIYSTAPNGRWVDDPPSDEDGNPVNRVLTTPVSIIVPETQWNITFTQVPHIFFRDTLVDILRSYIGTVNSEVMPLLFNAPAETILFMGYSLNQQFTWRTPTQPPFRITLKFAEKHVKKENSNIVYGHNHFWKADEGWKKLKFDGVNYAYKAKNLNNIFVW